MVSAAGADGISHYLQDDLGSPIRLLGEDGMERDVYGYDEFGNDLYHTSTANKPFTYTGYQKDPIAETYFAQAREYQPETGRFISEDIIKGSIAFSFTFHQYSYCWNQPMNFFDLNGLSREDAREYMNQYDTDVDSKRNPLFPSYETNCVNYVSQCLLAGGVDPVKYEWYCTSDLNLNSLEELGTDWK